MGSEMLDECIEALRSDRVVTLHIGVGEGAFSVQIQQKVLEATTEYFTAALRESTFQEGQTASITFEHDDVESWKALLFWMLHHTLPNCSEGMDAAARFMLRAPWWILGDKYGISKFQNEVMIQLLHGATIGDFVIAPTECKTLVMITPAKSPLMRLWAEELAYQVEQSDTDREELAALDGTLGFWPAYLEAQHRCQESDSYFNYRLCGIVPGRRHAAHWTQYMIGGPPQFVGYLRVS